MKTPLKSARRLVANAARARFAEWARRFAGGSAQTARKREAVFSLLSADEPPAYAPAGLFIHFGPFHKRGRAAVEKHLQYFRYTDMDILKVQFESVFPHRPEIMRPGDWAKLPRYGKDFFAPQLKVVEALVNEAKRDAPVIATLYSPFQCAGHVSARSRAPRADTLLTQHLREDPERTAKGLEIVTDGILTYARECAKLGVDGFLASTQGGEAFRFEDERIFRDFVKPFDLEIMKEIQRTGEFNILHICDYHGDYGDLTPFLDYPAHVVNCSLKVGARTESPTSLRDRFARPFMGGIDRKGLIDTGSWREMGAHVARLLDGTPDRFILGASCTLSSDIDWRNVKAAVDAAHQLRAR